MPESDGSIKYFNSSKAGLLSEILNEEIFLSSEEFKKLLKLGAIYINNERQIKNKIIPENNSFRIHTEPRRYECNFDWRSLIIFENDFCLVLNKPSGVPSHPQVDNAIENSLTQVSRARKYPLFITHRLDTLTSGLIVYGKKPSFVKSFNLQLQERSITKKYAAVVESTQNLIGKVTHYMDPLSSKSKKISDTEFEGWQLCELEVIEQENLSSNLSWVKIHLLTGRTHQIRAQLSYLKAPIVGDLLYNASLPFKKNAIALRSCEIEFKCNEEILRFNLNEKFDLQFV